MSLTFVVTLGVVLAAQTVVLWFLSRSSPPVSAANDLEPRVVALELLVKGLPSLWESERSRAEAAANAARVSRARAEKLIRERSEQLDAGEDLRRADEGSRREETVPAMSRGVDPRHRDPYATALVEQSITNLKAI